MMRIGAKANKIVTMLENGMPTPKEVAKTLGREYTEFKVQSMVLTLARKGLVDRTKALMFLRGTEMVKFLDTPMLNKEGKIKC